MTPIDLRSDTVTRPTAAMRDAMMSAPLGDDVFGDDPTVHALQDYAAKLLGKERALFVPTGTMANQLALRSQTRPGDEIIAHAKSHIFNYEGGGFAVLSGVSVRTVTSTDGTMPLEQVRAALHLSDDPHFAPTSLLCAENTQNACGGVVVDLDHLQDFAAVAREHRLRAHLDGARLANAAVASGTSLAAQAAPFDTVSLCFSKGLGAPVGSVLAGDVETIARAYRFRKMFGGGMRQAGVLAGAALYALEHHIDRLQEDHDRARRFAEELARLPGVHVDVDLVHTNLVYYGLSDDAPLALRARAKEITPVALLAEHGVLVTGTYDRMRAAFHLDVDDSGAEQALAVFKKLSN